MLGATASETDPLLAFLTVEELCVLVAIAGSPLLLGFALAAHPLHRAVGIALFLAGPIVATVAYQIINPYPNCDSDCIGRGVWVFLMIIAVLAWWFGLALGAIARRIKRGQPRP